MTPLSPVRAAYEGLQARLTESTALVALLAHDADADVPSIYRGWPTQELLEEDAQYFPMVTWDATDDEVLGGGVHRIPIVIDEWVWPDGSNGGDERLEAIDTIILARLGTAEWHHGGRRISCVLAAGRNDPTRRDDWPLRRTRSGSLIVS
jgi:hypothetical protein